jgi:hypothetical protein
MAELCLLNYYHLIHKANIHFSSTNFYKDLVRVHLPKLLEYWADLMLFHGTNQIRRKELLDVEEREDQQEQPNES